VEVAGEEQTATVVREREPMGKLPSRGIPTLRLTELRVSRLVKHLPFSILEVLSSLRLRALQLQSPDSLRWSGMLLPPSLFLLEIPSLLLSTTRLVLEPGHPPVRTRGKLQRMFTGLPLRFGEVVGQEEAVRRQGAAAVLVLVGGRRGSSMLPQAPGITSWLETQEGSLGSTVR